MSILARSSALVRPATRPFVRHASHQTPKNLHVADFPFKYSHRKAFAAKFVAYCGVGFAVPFIAGIWQLSKGAGSP
ncbi:hypothetical protein JAAARDRAFT_35081 [Jaapia argillacea MUCL 33604]|uniref:Cytochrome c oxidase subunit 8, mitochondrial n=1 Tax=Jaapia argillacea MUCL 33604 TaxID=933084 RepID=A0A067PTX9_9AGAM|nr:hypothetical protein JAAARDRAFT_35081 [Jaapia argillacea MUCL 33604]